MTNPALFYSPLSADPDLYDIVALFVEELPQRLEAMQTALSTSDWEQLIRNAHQLKGASGSYGFHPLAYSCHALEAAAEQQAADTAQQVLLELTDLCHRVRADRPTI